MRNEEKSHKESKEFINFSLKPKNQKKIFLTGALEIKAIEQVRERKVQTELFHIFLFPKYCKVKCLGFLTGTYLCSKRYLSC